MLRVERDRIKSLEREVRELRQGEEDEGDVQWTFPQTSEILRKAPAYSAPRSGTSLRDALPGGGTELDRPFER